MRTKDWRRYKEEVKIRKRLKKLRNHSWCRIIDANNNYIEAHKWSDMIGTKDHFMYKTYVTSKYSTSNSARYGKRGNKKWYYSNEIKTRVKDKKFFKKMLQQDYGIKHFNINYEFIKNYTEQ